MSRRETGPAAASLQEWQMALSRWDNEGGAGPAGPQRGPVSREAQPKILELTNAELVQLGSVHTVMQHYVHALHRGPVTHAKARVVGDERCRKDASKDANPAVRRGVRLEPDETER